MEHFGFVHLRTPLQSLEKAYQTDKDFVELFEEGLFLTSPEYWKQFNKYALLSAKQKEKLTITYDKFWVRSCSRCTPYGTFAGTSVVQLDNQTTSLILSKKEEFKRAVRLDMNFLYSIVKSLEKESSIESQIKLFKNNSIYETPLSFRYAEYKISNNLRQYQLVSVEKTEYISSVLDMAKSGASIGDLSDMLSELTDSTYEEARQFIRQMRDSQLLVTELEPSITGADPFKSLLQKLRGLKSVSVDLEKLSLISNMINNACGIPSYFEIGKLLGQIFNITLPKNTFQVDLFLNLKESKIKKSIIDSVFAQLEELMVFTRTAKSPTLDNFKTKFLDKFETREVPLSIALDAEFGVGYTGLSSDSIAGSNWIDDIPYSAPDTINKIEFDIIQQYSFNKYHECINENKDIIEIEKHELLKFAHDYSSQFPNSMYLTGSFLKKNELFDENNYLFELGSIGGPSGGNLLGRFTFGDKTLEKHTKIVVKEEGLVNQDVIYAEIAHLPEERLGNILLRPLLRDYEIPYLGHSGAGDENQILIEDLMVQVIRNEIIIRSRRLNKRVIPRLTTAHNFSNFRNLPIYQFLCDLQFQAMSFPVIWDWGILETQKYLPRVVYNNIIVRKARWRVNINDITEPNSAREYPPKDLSGVLSNRGFPTLFLIKQGDNKLLINLNKIESINILIKFIRKYKEIVIEEFLFNEDNCIVQDDLEKPYTNEVVIPFKTRSTILNKHDLKNVILWETKRKFPPGSEWLYFKIYCGPKIAEDLLVNPIHGFIEESLIRNEFERFFFIRYKDSLPHIRIRFYNSNPEMLQKTQANFMRILNPFIETEMVHSVTLDTYVQELERYEVDLIEDAEKLFFNDSLAIMRIIGLLNEEDEEKYRILLALRGIDQLLDDFKLSLSDKLELLKIIARGMLNRFGGHPHLIKRINSKYKQFQKSVFQHMNAENDKVNGIEEAISYFGLRSEMNKDVIQSIYSKIANENQNEKLNRLLPSYIHMFVNRFFIAQQLKYELLVYIFLERYYSSVFSIQNKN